MVTFRNVRTYLERRHILHYQGVVFGIYTKEPKTEGAQSAPTITAHPGFCSAVRVYIHFCVAERPHRYHMLSVTLQLHSNVALLSDQRQSSHLFSMTYSLNFPVTTDIISLANVQKLSEILRFGETYQCFLYALIYGHFQECSYILRKKAYSALSGSSVWHIYKGA